MASRLWKLCNNNLTCTIFNVSVRHGHHLKGKPPGIARSLEQRLEEINYKDPELTRRVDISVAPPARLSKEEKQKRLQMLGAQRKDADLEKNSRNRTLKIDMDNTYGEWLKTTGPGHIKEIADHYGVFQHLFGDAYFYPRIPLTVQYKVKGEDIRHSVFYGNVIKPSDASLKPEVNFDSEQGALWTLILTNPDGHFTNPEKEYVHWFVGNIQGNNVEGGDTIIDYLQPFPPRGTGYHRFIFVLYKHEKPIDFTSYKSSASPFDLSSRTFSTLDFYRKLQDDITPAGLAFFQSDWDRSLTKFYHNKLEMKEPVFEYNFDQPYIKPQKWFPIREPFNLYMDKYRDPKQINKEFLERKLKHVHPFKKPEAPLPYPNAKRFDRYIPTWLQLEMTKSKLKWGRINDIE